MRETNWQVLRKKLKESELKILLTVHQFLPEHASGTEILTYSVAKELLAQGHEVTVFTGFPAAVQLEDNDRLDRYELEGIKVVRFHHAVVRMGGQRHITEIEYCNLLAARYFKQLVIDVAPDVIHFFHLSRLGAALMDVAFAAGIKAYSTPTDFWSVCPTSQLLLDGGQMCSGPSRFGGNCVKHVAQLTRTGRAKKIIRLIPEKLFELGVRMTAGNLLPAYRFSHEITAMSRRKEFIVKRLNALNKIVSPTQLMTDVLLANGVNETCIVKSAYGIDTSFYDQYSRGDIGDKPVTIGFIGTLASHKGCHVLLNAMRLLEDKNIRLKIYGRSTDFPDYYAQLRGLAEADARIEFCGTFPNDQIGRVMSEIDVLVVPSLWYENTPLVIYSALASGCPVVASDFPGMSEVIVNDANGLLFKPGDAAELRNRLHRFCTEKNLLASLRGRCSKPKSTHEYVNELLALYRADRAGDSKAPVTTKRDASWLKLNPIGPVENCGSLIGWAIFQRAAPVAIRLVANGVVVSDVHEFSPRSDVIDGFKANGLHVKSALIGFMLSIPAGIDRTRAAIELIAKSGQVSSVSFSMIECGRSLGFADEVYLGLDSERWPAVL